MISSQKVFQMKQNFARRETPLKKRSIAKFFSTYFILQTLPTSGGNEGETPQERMSKLYQEELSRLMQSQKRALQGASAPGAEGGKNDLPAALPGLFPGLAGGLFQRAQQSDLQRAMDVYQQEFSRIQQNAFAAAIRAQQNGNNKELDESRAKTETPNPPESPATSTGGGDINTKSPGGTRQESPLGKLSNI